MKNRITINNTIASILLQLVTIISGFIIPRLILSTFGSEVNGLVSSINQFLQYIALVEGGLTPVILSSLYLPLKENNKERISGIINAASSFFRKIAIIFIVYSVLLALIYPFLLKTDFSYAYVSSLTLILSINLFVQYYFSLTWKTLLRADKKVYYTSLVQILCIVLNTISAIVVIRVWPDIHFLKIVTSIVFLLQPLLYNRYVKRHYDIDKSVLKDEKALSQRWNGFSINTAGFIHNNTDIVVLSLFTDLLTVSIYSVYNMVSVSLKKLIGSISEGIIPTLGHTYVSGDQKKLNNLFDIYEAVIYYVTFILFTAGGILITPFVLVYTKGINDANYMQPVFGWIIILAEMVHCIKEPYVNMAYCAGKFKDISKHAIIEMLINIVVSVVLVFKFGLIGVAIGTLLAMLYRTAFHIYYLKKHILNRKISITLKSVFVYSVTFLIILFLSNLLLKIDSISVISWVVFAIQNTLLIIFIYTLVFLLFYKNIVLYVFNYFKLKISNKIYKLLIFLVSLILIIYIAFISFMNNVNIIDYKKVIDSNNYIAHALGGIDNNSYTNSLEALNTAYNNGFKLFEVDIRFTSDNKLVCVHGWSVDDYKNKIGLDYNGIMTYETFINSKIKDKYTTISYDDIVKFMEKNTDTYFMIDIGKQSYNETKKIYSAIVKSTNKKLLNRLIVGGHTTDMIKAVKDVYNFKIMNLYWANKDNRDDDLIRNKDSFLNYCKRNKILSLSTSVDTFNNDRETINYFKNNGMIVYVFTENNKQLAEQYLKYVDVVGTDFITFER